MLTDDSWGKMEEAGDVWKDDVCLPKQPLGATEPCLPGGG